MCKRMKQLLRLHQIRSTNLTSVEATVRALLIAWALHEETVVHLRTLLPTGTSMDATPLSSWLLTGLGLDMLRQQVQGTWSEARLRACLPRLRRFLASAPTPQGASGIRCAGLAGPTSFPPPWQSAAGRMRDGWAVSLGKIP